MSHAGYKDIISSRYGSVPRASSYRASESSSYSQNAGRSQRLNNSGRIKLDRVSISEEAKNIHNSNGESASQTYKRLQKLTY